MPETTPAVADANDPSALPPDAGGPAAGLEPPYRPRNPVGPAIVAWLVPGAGHAMIGRRWPALFVALGIWPLFVGGFALAGFENVNWVRHPYLMALQGLCGLPAGVAALLTQTVEPDFLRFPHHTVGDLGTCVAGLLNLVAVADVWTRCTAGDPELRLARKRAGLDAPADATDDEGGAESLLARRNGPEAPRG